MVLWVSWSPWLKENHILLLESLPSTLSSLSLLQLCEVHAGIHRFYRRGSRDQRCRSFLLRHSGRMEISYISH